MAERQRDSETVRETETETRDRDRDRDRATERVTQRVTQRERVHMRVVSPPPAMRSRSSVTSRAPELRASCAPCCARNRSKKTGVCAGAPTA